MDTSVEIRLDRPASLGETIRSHGDRAGGGDGGDTGV